jgi:lipopolysaccharide transport system permease protein
MTSVAASEPRRTLVIEADKIGRQYWGDLWRYKELFILLSMRDIVVRYKQTVIGVAWSVLRPLFTMIAFTIVFGHYAHLDPHGAPYPLFVLAGTLPWQFFSSGLGDCSLSMTANAPMMSKVYFPRLIVPICSVVVTMVDFLVSLSIGLVMCVYYHFTAAHYMPTWRLLLMPLFLAMAFFAALGPGLLFSALNVKYRDFRYIVPVILQFGIYVSPVGYGSYIVGKWRMLASLNPLFGIIDGFRWCVLGARQPIYVPGLAMSLLTVTLLFAAGLWYFRSSEQKFADII